ncbi:hypothetical protein [Myxococcus qinghaiensis]|uniref:hypothetical protein n=1 Tax=Myxococcus qinghaiensis TaxID=2906758 RepID=UPI0020A792C5|nr:hypothetical protein [Myxococcus qinghaiensis]MCP3165107.1 hypothetical protein [Myxococcus qinghaiensis]
MRNLLAVTASLFSLTFLGCNAAPAEPTPEPTPETSEQTQSLTATGQSCQFDTECASGLCWVEADSYPLYNPQWIHADSCTEECGGPTDHESCRLLALDLNAPYPNNARCIPARGVYDNYPYDDIFYVCDMLRVGLGRVHWSE